MYSEGSPSRKNSDVIEFLFSNRNIDELADYLQQHPEIDLLKVADVQRNTVLHQLAFEGHLDIIQLLVK